MRLLSYKLNVHPSVGTMDKYFHIMFRRVFPNINGNGDITNDKMGRTNQLFVKEALGKLTKEHPVGWQLKLQSMGKTYEVTAQNGEVEFRNVRPNENDSS